jgi:hypothetical protein
MSGSGKGDYSILQKIQVSCKTCGVSDSFYSNLSVEQFKSRHRGHDVVGGGREEPAPTASVVKPAPQKEEPMDTEAHTKLAKVKVDMVVFPVLPDPVFRVRGFKDDFDEAFITTVRFEHAAKVKEIIAGGEYVDHDLGNIRYVWEPDAVEFEGDVREKLGLPAEAPSPTSAAAPQPEELARPDENADDTVAKTNEMLFGKPDIVDVPEPFEDLSLSPPTVSTPPAATLEAPAPPAVERTVERQAVEAPAPPPSAAVKTEVRAVPSAPQAAQTRAAEEADEGQLLVSKSWYIQSGAGNKSEAVRISKVLKAFRWKVEPIYTIGVMLDDMLSIETARNQISRTLIMRIEGAGYRLTAVTTEQGKPVAWFKKSPEAPTGQADAQVKPAQSDDSGASGSTTADELDADLEPDLTG